jgi:hypothetical protein
MVPVLFVIAADEKYFLLAQSAIRSFRSKPEGRDAPLAFFDLGCSPDQLHWMAGQAQWVTQPKWEFDFPTRAAAPSFLRGLLARPFLRRYFPGFDVYFWIDSDAWIQDWSAVTLFIQGARKRGLAVVPELDRGNRWNYGHLPRWWQMYHGYYQEAFGEELARKLMSYPVLNAGVFALHHEAPHWEVWSELLNRALQRSCSILTDQLALNAAVYDRDLLARTELLPAWCNWTCHYGLPAWDADRKLLVEPYLPHVPIGILHHTGAKPTRYTLETTGGGTAVVATLYPPVAFPQPVGP